MFEWNIEKIKKLKVNFIVILAQRKGSFTSTRRTGYKNFFFMFL